MMDGRKKVPRTLRRCICTRCKQERLVTSRGVTFVCDACKPKNHHTFSPQYKAQQAVAYAKRRGQLRPASDFDCVDCGHPASEYDHRDYSKPLQVDPVCRGCNLRRGPAIGWNAQLFTKHILQPAKGQRA